MDAYMGVGPSSWDPVANVFPFTVVGHFILLVVFHVMVIPRINFGPFDQPFCKGALEKAPTLNALFTFQGVQ